MLRKLEDVPSMVCSRSKFSIMKCIFKNNNYFRIKFSSGMSDSS